MDFSLMKEIHIPVYYTCNGTESGECDSIINGTVYRFTITSAAAGAKLGFINGKFYTSGSIVISQPEEQTGTREISASTETQEIIIPPDPLNPEETGGGAIFTLPDSVAGQDILINVKKVDDAVVVTYRLYNDTTWVEVPAISVEEVYYIDEDDLSLVMVFAEQDGDAILIS